MTTMRRSSNLIVLIKIILFLKQKRWQKHEVTKKYDKEILHHLSDKAHSSV